MNRRFYIICIAAVLTLGVPTLLSLGVPFLADSSVTATVHGVTYEVGTFEPLNNTVIDINSTPPQSIVAKNGMYSFELVPGDYAITAKYYQNNTLTYSKEVTFKIEDGGDYVFDPVLFPVSETQGGKTLVPKTNNPSEKPTEQTKTDSSTINYLLIALTLFLLFGGGYRLSRKHKKIEKNMFQEGKFNIRGLLVKVFGKSTGSGVRPGFENIEEAIFVKEPIIEPADDSEIETAALKKHPISTDLLEVMDVIRDHKGRITQKDLRSRLGYSEVKVSLLLSELEKKGLIKKFKNGRENIVTLIDEKC